MALFILSLPCRIMETHNSIPEMIVCLCVCFSIYLTGVIYYMALPFRLLCNV